VDVADGSNPLRYAIEFSEFALEGREEDSLLRAVNTSVTTSRPEGIYDRVSVAMSGRLEGVERASLR
jgi:hypothetical protein